jgi:hypothetical protein
MDIGRINDLDIKRISGVDIWFGYSRISHGYQSCI